MIHSSSLRASRGFTLIEVLVAVVVVSLGMLGIAGTLVTASRSASSNYLKQQAVQYAYDIVDRMRANDTLAAGTAGSTNPYIVAATVPSATPPTATCVSAPCSATQMAALDVWQWQTLLKQNLPAGVGSVQVATGNNSTATVTVTVSWSDQPANVTFKSTTPAALSSYTVVSAL